MPRDLRLSRMLHVLIHLDRHVERATSDQIAGMISTNPVVVRRMMAGLREKEILISEKGHRGGLATGPPFKRDIAAGCLRGDRQPAALQHRPRRRARRLSGGKSRRRPARPCHAGGRTQAVAAIRRDRGGRPRTGFRAALRRASGRGGRGSISRLFAYQRLT